MPSYNIYIRRISCALGVKASFVFTCFFFILILPQPFFLKLDSFHGEQGKQSITSRLYLVWTADN